MIRHINNKPPIKVKGLKEIAKLLGHYYGDKKKDVTIENAARIYTFRKKKSVKVIPNVTTFLTGISGESYQSRLLRVEKEGRFYEITKDNICTYKSAMMFDLQSIADHLYISKRKLSYLKKNTDFPVYKLKDEEGHKSFFVMKNQIAHWYFDYLMSCFGPNVTIVEEFKKILLKNDIKFKYIQKAHTDTYKKLLNFTKKVKCAYCGKNLFLLQGVNCREYSSAEIINNIPIKEHIYKNPVCPECGEATFPCNAFHDVITF